MDSVDSDLSGTKSQDPQSAAQSDPASLVHSSTSSSSSSSFSSSSHCSHPLATSTSHPVVNGGNKPHSQTSEDHISSLSGVRKDASRYQLVYGLDETSSETSLTDSPVLHDPSNRLLLHSSLEESGTDVTTNIHLTHSEMVASSLESRGSHDSSSSSSSSSSCPQLLINADSSPLPHANEGNQSSENLISESSVPVPDPVRGDVESTDGTSKDQKPISSETSALSCNSQTNAGDSSSSKLCPPQDRVISNPLPTSDPGLETGSSLQQFSDSHNLDPEVKLDDISLHSRSTSPGVETLKVHPLSLLTSDSDADENCPSHTDSRSQALYSPIPNTSG